MAKAFDPDKYLAEKAEPVAQAPRTGFDPDAYLAEKSAPAQKQWGDRSIEDKFASLRNPTQEDKASALSGLGKMLDYPGGIIRTGLASSAGMLSGKGMIVKPQDLAAAERGEAPTSAEYMERLGVPEGKVSLFGPLAPAVPLRDVGGFALDVATDPLTLASKATSALRPAGAIAESAGGKLVSTAEQKAFKSSGAMLKDFRKAAGKDEVNKLGRFMLDEKMIAAGDSFDDVAKKAAQINEAAGKELDDVYTKAVGAFDQDFAAKMPGFNPVKDKAEILKAVADDLGDAKGAKAAVNDLATYLDDLGEKYGDGVLNPRAQNDIKGHIDDVINYARDPLKKEPNAEKAYSVARKYLANKIEQSIDYVGKQTGDADLVKKLKAANSRYGSSKQIGNIAKDRVNRESANRMYGLTDTIVGGAVGTAAGGAYSDDPTMGMIKGLGMGLLGGTANKVARTYGNGVLSKGMDASGKALKGAGKSGILDSVARRGLLNKKKKGQLEENESAPSLMQSESE